MGTGIGMGMGMSMSMGMSMGMGMDMGLYHRTDSIFDTVTQMSIFPTRHRNKTL